MEQDFLLQTPITTVCSSERCLFGVSPEGIVSLALTWRLLHQSRISLIGLETSQSELREVSSRDVTASNSTL